ncbi:GNAT family N-acetyltransferase [Planosporangium sp. 12N6]|uniref:GNAT family N-acetyltransferase n=1 Tax=Planosporangium spinosum TaxID=3402278 RepID=UPI003CE84A84
MTVLETARLVLRRWRPDDAPAMAEINGDPEVMRWIGDGSTSDLARTEAGIAACERHWDEHGFGLFAVEVRDTGELAGFTGLATPDFLPEIMPAVEIGWRLGRRYWGHGYATEAAGAALRFAFAGRGLDRIVSVHQVGNTASERVMHKLGMRLDREAVQPSCGRPVRVYAISRAGWAAEQERGPVPH